jgi:hypothetical protein
MPTSDLPSEVYTRSKFLDNLPRHRTFGLLQRPETWFEMIFGPSPKANSSRYIYENKEEGFYNFI